MKKHRATLPIFFGFFCLPVCASFGSLIDNESLVWWWVVSRDRYALIYIVALPVAYFILRLIFKKSIMFIFSFAVCLLLYFVSYTSLLMGIKGVSAMYYIMPLNFIVGTSVFLFINKTLRKPLNFSINKVKELSKGNLNIELEQVKKTMN